MNKSTVTAILAAVVGVSGFATSVYADHDDDRRDEDRRYEDRHSDRTDHREYRDALRELKDARRILASVGGDWDGRRGQAMQQVNYAIEQVYAGIGDDAAKARDQDQANRELQEAKDNRRDRDQSIDRRRRDMNSALDHLRSARRDLDRVPSDDSRRQKSIEFTDQAIKDVQMALSTLK